MVHAHVYFCCFACLAKLAAGADMPTVMAMIKRVSDETPTVDDQPDRTCAAAESPDDDCDDEDGIFVVVAFVFAA